jgi:hypothetical protein
VGVEIERGVKTFLTIKAIKWVGFNGGMPIYIIGKFHEK